MSKGEKKRYKGLVIKRSLSGEFRVPHLGGHTYRSELACKRAITASGR